MRTGISRLDFKLGARMLLKYPGLTLVGGLAIAFAIWISAGTFELVTQVVDPTLPLDDGDRIVGMRNWNVAQSDPELPSLHDFVMWREELESVEELSAFRTLERNLSAPDIPAGPVEVAQISPSGFRVARVPALLGRPLVQGDERAGAPPVAVIAYDVWQRRFAGDPAVVGREVRLGSTLHTVVGVMPEDFAFPVNHSIWAPLRLRALDYERGEAPGVRVFGRLAPGATLAEAQAELAAIGRRAAAEFPETHEDLRPRVLPYAASIVALPLPEGVHGAALYSFTLLGVLLIVLMCGNVALLMFARAATREGEIAVRTALGASRGRIIGQLFIEALVLAGIAAVIGLAAAGFGLRWLFDTVAPALLGEWRLPFWFRPGLSPATLLYAALLTVLGALVAGVAPGLKVTRGLGARLRRTTAGGGGGFRFGGVWTAVIVAQVAITVLIPVFAYVVLLDVVRIRTADVGVAEDEYLTVRLEMGPQTGPGFPDPGRVASGDTSRADFLARFEATYRELERRLLAEPAVVGVTYANRLPRMYHPYRLVEVDEGGAAPLDPRWPAYRVSSASVAPDYAEVLGAPILAGRGFAPGDVRAGPGDEPGVVQPGLVQPGVVLVNQSFVDLVLGGRNPIGRRVRYVGFESSPEPYSPDAEPAPWHEIVGVVPDMGTNLGVSSAGDPKVAALYHPVAPGTASPVHLALHVRGDPEAFAPRLRRIATAVDPSLRLYEILPLSELSNSELKFLSFWLGLVVVVIGVTLLLSLAGIFAVMSFTVAQRTREIGIRIALGADVRRILLTIFRRPLIQVALGIAAGIGLIVALILAATGGLSVSVRGVAIVVGYAALMVGVCMLACIVPTRRALGVEPTEALRYE